MTVGNLRHRGKRPMRIRAALPLCLAVSVLSGCGADNACSGSVCGNDNEVFVAPHATTSSEMPEPRTTFPPGSTANPTRDTGSLNADAYESDEMTTPPAIVIPEPTISTYWRGSTYIGYYGIDFDADPPTKQSFVDIKTSVTKGERVTIYAVYGKLAKVPTASDVGVEYCRALLANEPDGVKHPAAVGDRYCNLTNDSRIGSFRITETFPHGGAFEKNRVKVQGTVWTDPKILESD